MKRGTCQCGAELSRRGRTLCSTACYGAAKTVPRGTCRCGATLKDLRTTYCSPKCPRDARAASPAGWIARAIEMSAEGCPTNEIAEALGKQPKTIRGKLAKLGHHMPKLRTPERDAIMRRDYAAGVSFDVIADALNKLPGRRVRNPDQLVKWAKALKVSRPPWWRASSSAKGHETRWGARDVAPEVPGILRKAPRLILPREVYQWGAMLGLPLAKRGDIGAVSRAARLDDPTHPGFALRMPASRGATGEWR